MEIEKIRNANTKYIAKDIIYEEQMDSTQTQAMNRKKENKNGTVFLTDYQTKGMGTKGRSWYSPNADNIMMTIALYPNCYIDQLDGFTYLIAEVMKKVIYDLYNIILEIKLPNDLLLNQKKIAGILTQSFVYQRMVKELYIGIGFNVNEINFENEIQEIATSLKKEFHHDFNRGEIIITFIQEFEKELIKRKIIE